MITTEKKTLKASPPSTQFDYQALVITAPNDYKKVFAARLAL